jgi:hypothetical protein
LVDLFAQVGQAFYCPILCAALLIIRQLGKCPIENYDALPDANDEKQKRRRFNQHFISLVHDYLPEHELDVDEVYQAWSHVLGRPAILPSYEHEIDPARLIGLRGPYCCYLSRTIISPEERPAYIVDLLTHLWKWNIMMLDDL